MAQDQWEVVLRRLRNILVSKEDEELADADLLQRFVERRDEAAFTVLVRRHGGMVFKVCRNVLCRDADSDDAFQAAFLVLARKAAAVKKRKSVASWLHGVALRCALNLRKKTMRRRKHEAAAVGVRLPRSPATQAALNELQAVVDEEVERLSEKCRAAFVLCVLESKSRTDAAQTLGCSEGTLASRLAKAREILQKRLTARGATLTATLCAVDLAPGAASAVPAALALGAVEAAINFVTCKYVGSVSTQVLAIAEEVLKSMFVTKLKAGVALVLATTLTVFVAGGLIAQPDDTKKLAASDVPQIVAGKAEPKDKQAAVLDSDADFVLTGAITDGAKKPVFGAKVTALGSWEENGRSAKSNLDGSFRLQLRTMYRDHLPPELHTLLLMDGPKGELGFASISQKKPEPVQLSLKAPAQVTVDVNDGAGTPVVGADVFVISSVYLVARGKTGADGRWTGHIPVDAMDTNWGVFALKSKAGFDYVGDPRRAQERAAQLQAHSNKIREQFEKEFAEEKRGSSKVFKNREVATDAPPKVETPKKVSERMPSRIRLTLGGARSVRVKTVDRDSKPIAGIKVAPWYLQKEGQPDINLSGIEGVWRTTSVDGLVFDWLPADSRRIPFVASGDEFHTVEISNSLMGLTPDAELTIVVSPTERISGRVTQMDGRPAPGIRVEAETIYDGVSSAGLARFRGATRTDAQGRYSFKAYPDQALVIKVAEENGRARERRGWTVQVGKPLEGIDLVLKPKTPEGTTDPKKAAALARDIADRKPFSNSIDIRFVWIPPGEFLMGSPVNEKGRFKIESQHLVKLTRGFYMSVHPVTQEEWQEVMGNNPSRTVYQDKENLPVETVSWNECQEFIMKLSDLEKRAYRLPTEAEWEYACRAGTTTPYCFGEAISVKLANIDDGAMDRSLRRSMPVGSYPANAFGLRDMHASIHQWCQDWYGEYPQGEAVDPQGPAIGTKRVMRGGAYGDLPRFCRSAFRASLAQDRKYPNVGFRICFTD
jgi:RNA polymerase sigma factor (sigma-70 family)